MGGYDIHESVGSLRHWTVIQITVSVLYYSFLGILFRDRLLSFVHQVLGNHAYAVEVASRITDQVLELKWVLAQHVFLVVIAVVCRVLEVGRIVAVVVAIHLMHLSLFEGVWVAVALSQEQWDIDLVIFVQIGEVGESLLLVRRVVHWKAVSCRTLLLHCWAEVLERIIRNAIVIAHRPLTRHLEVIVDFLLLVKHFLQIVLVELNLLWW